MLPSTPSRSRIESTPPALYRKYACSDQSAVPFRCREAPSVFFVDVCDIFTSVHVIPCETYAGSAGTLAVAVISSTPLSSAGGVLDSCSTASVFLATSLC